MTGTISGPPVMPGEPEPEANPMDDPLDPSWERGGFVLGEHRFTDYGLLTQKQQAQWRRELEERAARRIPIGFQVP